MTNDRLAALRSRIGAEPAGPWLDCIVARFCELPGLRIVRAELSDDFAVEITEVHKWNFWGVRYFFPSNDHNACFAALAQLEKREIPILFRVTREGVAHKNWWWKVELSEHFGGNRVWRAYSDGTGVPGKVDSLPLVAARAIALAAVDNGVEVEL